MKISIDTKSVRNLFKRNKIAALIEELSEPAPREEMPRRIKLCEQALDEVDPLSKPNEWAALHYLLADSLEKSPDGDPAENQELAIHHYNESLRFSPRLSRPKLWALTQYNLSNVYSSRISGERAANQEQAIHYANQSLRVFTHEGAPNEWALLQIMLASCYEDRIEGADQENQERAIHYYNEALKVFTLDSSPIQWATAHLCLAEVYRTRLAGNGAENLQQAFAYCETALSVFARENSAVNCGLAHFKMGDICRVIPAGDHEENLGRAVYHYQHALSVFSQNGAPGLWRMTHGALALVYGDRRIAGNKDILERAIQHARLALENIDPGGSSLNDYGKAAELLGDLLFRKRDWDEARQIYDEALRIRQSSYKASTGIAGKYAELEQAKNLVLRYAYVLARCARPVEAVKLLENWRTRTVVEALQRNPPELAQAKQEDQLAYREATERIAKLQAEQRRKSGREYLITTIDLRAAYEELDRVISRIRAYLPGLLAGATYANIQGASAEAVPLAYLLTTETGSLVLFVPARGDPEPIWCDEFTEADLDAMLLDKGDRPQYLGGAVGGDKIALAHSLRTLLPVIGNKLIARMVAALKCRAATRVALIPCGKLALLPLHAAIYGNDECLLDDFTISFAPSAQVLMNAYKARQEHNTRISAWTGIGDCDNTLEYDGPELESIAKLAKATGGAASLLTGATATLKSFIAHIPGVSHLHLSCHGGFDVLDPLNSALLLGGGERLTLRTILDDPGFRALTGVRLIVMSACQTAIIDFRTLPDEFIGLPAGFLQAGVLGVIATLWPVADSSTALLMVRFYELLWVERFGPAEALRLAQRWLRDSNSEELTSFCHRHPSLKSLDYQFRMREIDYENQDDHGAGNSPAARPYAAPFFWAGFIFYGI